MLVFFVGYFSFHQRIFQVLVKGGIGSINIITQLAVCTAYIYIFIYTWYILPSRGFYNPYHLFLEPEESVDFRSIF